MDGPPSSEVRALIERCLNSDQIAMRELMALYKSLVFGLCLRMLGHREDAEDVTQEVFVRVFRSLKSWDATREFRPWLLAIAGNRCRTMLAARKRRAQPMEFVDDLPDPTPDRQDERTLAEELMLALKDVREEYRRAFLLFHEQELSYAEIAAAMDVPVGTIKTWVHRARRELIERLHRRGVVLEVKNER
ncbi:MAG TPA: RNA polymerase sigma factor [Pirellulales bacterium]